MPFVRLTAAQWTERHRRGLAAIVKGQRQAVLRETSTGALARVPVELLDADPASAVIDGRLDAEDLARVLTGFRGQPTPITPAMHHVRTENDHAPTVYVYDEETGMVYILD